MPVIEPLHYSGAQLPALTICIAGADICSHVNDAVSGCLPLYRRHRSTDAENWTLMETILVPSARLSA
jgi:Gnt-I system low-affinity gluconate transporter